MFSSMFLLNMQIKDLGSGQGDIAHASWPKSQMIEKV
jgi:hypothetical protein